MRDNKTECEFRICVMPGTCRRLRRLGRTLLAALLCTLRVEAHEYLAYLAVSLENVVTNRAHMDQL
jgi:hypothetical protein